MGIDELRACGFWSEREGRAALALWRRSGLSATAFAKRERWSRTRLLYWRARLEAPARSTSAPLALAPVTVIETRRSAGLSIECVSGRVVRIEGDVDDVLLARDPRAAVMLHHVKKLYEVEADATAASDTPEARLARRRELSSPVIEVITKWCADIRRREPPKSTLAGAVGYVLNQWVALTRFLQDGALPLDNTMVERALRGVAQGRKNFLFAGSDEGAIRAATIYTCMASCKLNGVEPTAWLTDVIAKIQTEQWPHGRLRELVPDEWIKSAPHAAIQPKR